MQSWLVITFEYLLGNGYNVTVEGPETDLWDGIARLLHRLQLLKDGIPRIPIQIGVGDIKDQHVHAGIRKHRNVVTYHETVRTDEITVFRLSPMIRVIVVGRQVLAVGPVDVVPETCIGMSGEDFRHIPVVQSGINTVIRTIVPGDIEHPHETAFFGSGTYFIGGGHMPPDGVGGHPGVLHQVLLGTDRQGQEQEGDYPGKDSPVHCE